AKAVEERLGDDGVLVLTIAGTMSGTFHAAYVAASLVKGRVRVLDTETAAGAEGLVVLAAAVSARDGAHLDEVEATAAHVREQVRAEVDPATEFVGSFSPVMVVHTGPGLVGLAWWWEERVGES